MAYGNVISIAGWLVGLFYCETQSIRPTCRHQIQYTDFNYTSKRSLIRQKYKNSHIFTITILFTTLELLLDSRLL